MGFFARLRTGLGLTRHSLDVVRREPTLVAFPAIAIVAGIGFLAVVVGGVSVVGTPDGVGSYAVVFGAYTGVTFVASFFTAGLMHQTRAVLDGEDPSLVAGLHAARTHASTLLAWSVLAGTVGLVARTLERKAENSLVARVVASVFVVAWTLLTYFVVPVVVFEDVGLRTALSRSGETVEQTWGETAGVGFGVGFVSLLLVVGGVVVAFAVVWVVSRVGSPVLGALALATAGVLVVGSLLLALTVRAVARTALYVYAVEGTPPDGFADAPLTPRR